MMRLDLTEVDTMESLERFCTQNTARRTGSNMQVGAVAIPPAVDYLQHLQKNRRIFAESG